MDKLNTIYQFCQDIDLDTITVEEREELQKFIQAQSTAKIVMSDPKGSAGKIEVENVMNFRSI